MYAILMLCRTPEEALCAAIDIGTDESALPGRHCSLFVCFVARAFVLLMSLNYTEDGSWERTLTTLERMHELGLTLPTPVEPIGAYRPVSIVGSQVYTSGLGPVGDVARPIGIVGRDVSLSEARDAARCSMLLILASLHKTCGLDDVVRCIRLTVYVRASEDFTEHATVADGATELLHTLYGPEKLPARSAIGVHSLPMGLPVEIDSIFELRCC